MKFEEYLQLANNFKLGTLTTESFHPLTKNLSNDSKNNLPKALNDLKEVDHQAFKIIKNKSKEIFNISSLISKKKKEGSRIFLCGCGATGRLSLAIETLALQENDQNIVSFMAGGDYALIKSVESFEDKVEYGAKQLNDLGFSENDILLAITEGGETSFVIGAALEATKISKNQSYFLYCNPEDEIIHLDRCREVINHPKVDSLNLTVGPMALSGSTRMQASSVQMFVAGMLAIKDFDSEIEVNSYIDLWMKNFNQLDFVKLKKLIEIESDIYLKNQIITYTCSADLAISVLTDTTERSPTFSLAGFEKKDDTELSFCYLAVDEAQTSQQAWNSMLGREPRPLRWGEGFEQISLEEIYKFDISKQAIERRKSSNLFKINYLDGSLNFEVLGEKQKFNIIEEDSLIKHLSLKLLLNTLSTLIMGRIGRYESNIMTWVKASNFKLIDRATRYTLYLLEDESSDISYEDVLKFIYEHSKNNPSEFKPIVMKAYEFFKN